MPPTQEQKDIIEIKGEIGKIRHHQDLQKSVNESQNKILNEIKNALVGSEMNGNLGLVSDVKMIKEKQKTDAETINTHKVYFRQIAYFIGVCSTLLVAIIIKVFFSK